MKIVIIAVVALGVLSNACLAEGKLKVVTTLSTFASLVSEIGGEAVEVSSVASARFNPHFIEPKPSDVLRVKRCDMFVHGGLDLEAWREPLLDAAGRSDLRKDREHQLDLSVGITLLNVPSSTISRSEGDIHLFGNPHYQLSPGAISTMAKSLMLKLSELDPVHRDLFAKNYTEFTTRLGAAEKSWSLLKLKIKGQELIGYHDEWVYLMNYLGLKMDHFLEPKPGIPPTPRQISELVRHMESSRTKVIVQASFFPTSAGEELAKRAHGKLVMLCQNVGELPECADTIAMIDYNINQIVRALSDE